MNIDFEPGNGTKWLLSFNIFAILGGAATIIWYAASMNSAVDQLEDWKDDAQETLQRVRTEQQEQRNDIVNLQAIQLGLAEDVEDLKQFHGIGTDREAEGADVKSQSQNDNGGK